MSLVESSPRGRGFGLPSSHASTVPGSRLSAGWLDAGWLLVCFSLSALWCLTAARQLSATYDEPVYLTCGLERWRTGSTAGLMRLGTMPLPVDVQTLPLYLAERWRGEPFDVSRDFSLLLPWARAMTLLFWGLLLGYAWRLARGLAGPWAGRLAVALLAFEPSLLGHAALATTDIAVAACLLAFVYHFRVHREAGWWKRVAWPALWCALATLAKASGLIFAGLCMLALEWERGRAKSRTGISLLRNVAWRDLFQIGFLALGLVFLYCGCDWKAEPTFVAWAEGLPESLSKYCLVWIAKHLRIFSNAGVALARQVTHNLRGHACYLLGYTAPRSIWYYFPVVLSMKCTIPFLALPLVLVLARRRSLRNGILACAGLLLLFSLNCRVQIGVRFMFPLVALAAVGLAAAVVQTGRVWGPGARRAMLGLGCLLGIGWTIGEAVAVWPEGICYVNELWGGTEEGYRLVSDANYDWGQGLLELERWSEGHPELALRVWYFGTDPRAREGNLLIEPLHTYPIHNRVQAEERLSGSCFAVSTTLLHGGYGDSFPAMTPLREFFQSRQPCARTSTFLIYDLRKPESPAASGE
jgi:hypothetical protein